jgi:hypothetical protein
MLAAAAGALGGCGASTSTSGTSHVVASVQGTPIVTQELHHWEAIKRDELQTPSGPKAPSPAQVQQAALAFLITSVWLEKEAAAHGFTASLADAESSFLQLSNGQAGPAFLAGLQRRGITRADELRILRLAALASKLRGAIAGGAGGSSAAGAARLSSYLAAYQARWRQRTTCASGYKSVLCSNG